MPRDTLKLLEYEAKRRPAIAHLIANLDTLTEDQINQAAVPLPWMRQALLALKRKRTHAMIMAQEVPDVVDAEIVDQAGEMRRWEGSARFVRIGRTEVEMQPGQLIWCNGSGIWIDTIFTRLIDPALRNNTVSCGTVSRRAYMAAVRDRTNSLAPVATITATPAPAFRVYRPG